MAGAGRFKLRFGPYRTPRFRYGCTLRCELRGELVVCGLTSSGRRRRPHACDWLRGRVHCCKRQSERVPPMSEVTRILSAIEGGDPHAASQLLPLVYDELRRLAAQVPPRR